MFSLFIFLGCYGCGGHTLGSHFFFSKETAKLLIGLLMMRPGKSFEDQPFVLFQAVWGGGGCELADIQGFFLLFLFDTGALLPRALCW